MVAGEEVGGAAASAEAVIDADAAAIRGTLAGEGEARA